MKYSLADYILSITTNDASLTQMFGNVTVGGEGSALDSISISTSQDLWNTTGFATGAWVHNKNLSRVGTVEVSISQLSEKVAKFKQMVNIFYSGDYDGFTFTLSDSYGNKVCTCVDVYPTKIPNQSFGSDAAMQSWSFTAGEITFN